MLPDLEVVMVTYIKTEPSLFALHNGRVSTNLPDDPFGQDGGGVTETDPYVTVFRIGGAPENNEGTLLFDRGLVQFDFWGPPGAYRTASEVARTFVAAASGFTGLVAASGPSNTAWVNYIDIVTGPRRVHEPETNWARFIVEAFVHVREEENV